MSQILSVLSNYSTPDKLEMIELTEKLKTEDRPMHKAMMKCRLEIVTEEVKKQAKIVLSGECPHDRPIKGWRRISMSPRYWISWQEERPIFGPCRFCGG